MFRRSWDRIPAPCSWWTFICCKKCNVGLKKTKICEKEAGDGPFKKQIFPCKFVFVLGYVHCR